MLLGARLDLKRVKDGEPLGRQIAHAKFKRLGVPAVASASCGGSKGNVLRMVTA